MEINSAVAAQIAQTRQNSSTSFIRQNAQADQQIANVLDASISRVPGSPVRGVNVDINA